MTDPFLLDPAVEARGLRDALGRFVTGVTVVTARGHAGPVGMTVNSFSSVSLSPPMVLFCVGHRSQLRDALRRATAFAVNVLGEGQLELSRQFGRPGHDRFGSAHWRPGTTGSPVLVGSLTVLECVSARVVEMGDHDIVIGKVVSVHPPTADRPLVFYSGEYRRLSVEHDHQVDTVEAMA